VTAKKRRIPPAVPTVPTALLRAQLEHELGTVSLRQAAREIGLSPNAIKNFLAGAEPRRTTRVKLERWLASRPQSTRTPGLAQFVRLLQQISSDLPERDTRHLGRELSRLLLDTYRRNHLPPSPMGPGGRPALRNRIPLSRLLTRPAKHPKLGACSLRSSEREHPNGPGAADPADRRRTRHPARP
jgi:hypothetical protein